MSNAPQARTTGPAPDPMPTPPSLQREVVVLPVGLTIRGGVHKDAEIREMTGRDEEAVGAVLGKNRNNYGQAITALLAGCCSRVGTLDRASMPAKEWADIFQAMTMPDRDTLMIRVRVLSFGNSLEQAFTCPACKTKFMETVDLDTIEVKPFAGHENFLTTLTRGHVDKDGNTHKTVVYRLPTGMDQEQLSLMLGKNESEQNTLFLTRCIQKLGNIESPPSSIIRDLPTRDRIALMDGFMAKLPGPDMALTTTCPNPNCGESYKRRLESEHFFTT